MSYSEREKLDNDLSTTSQMNQIRSAIVYSIGIQSQEASAYIRIISPFNKLGIYLIDGIKEGLSDLDLVREADIVIVHRFFPENHNKLHMLVEKCRYYNKKLIFDIDDLLFDLPKQHSDRLKFSFTEFLLPIYYVIQEADLVTTSTSYLKDQISELNENIIVLPNYIDDELWKFKSIEKNNSELVIGYMGTKTHIKDLELISSALIEVLDCFSGRVLLKIYGFEPPGILKQHPFVLYDNQFHISYPEFAKYFQNQDIDICIAPLTNNLFNKCKSNIKFLEYSISGIPGVYSRIKPYKEVIVENNNGLLANSVKEWEYALKSLIKDKNLRLKLASKAQATVKESWTLSGNIHNWLSCLENQLLFAGNKKRLERKRVYFLKTISEQYLEFTSHLRKSTAILEEQVRHKDRAIAALEEQVCHKDRVIAALEEQVRHKDDAIAALEGQIEILNQEITSKIAQIVDLQKEILSYILSLSWKITRPLRILRKKIEGLIS